MKFVKVLVSVFVAAALMGFVGCSNEQPVQQDQEKMEVVDQNDGQVKHIVVTVKSDRDDMNQVIDVDTDSETLGDWVKTNELFDYEDTEYGTYIKSIDGCSEDVENEFWWQVQKNGVPSETGVDSIILEDGQEYNFVLAEGF